VTCNYITKFKQKYESHISSQRHIKIVNNEKCDEYKCVTCNYITKFKQNYERHLSSERHKQIDTNEKCDEYKCETCNYITKFKQNYERHLSSQKHKLCDELEKKNKELEEEKKNKELEEENKNKLVLKTNNIKNSHDIEKYLNNKYPNALTLQDFASNVHLNFNEIMRLPYNEINKKNTLGNVLKTELENLEDEDKPMIIHKKYKWFAHDVNEGWKLKDGNKILKVIEQGLNKLFSQDWHNKYPYWQDDTNLQNFYPKLCSMMLNYTTEKEGNQILNDVKKYCEFKMGCTNIESRFCRTSNKYS